MVLVATFRNSSNSLLMFSLLVLPFKRPFYCGQVFFTWVCCSSQRWAWCPCLWGVPLLVSTSFPTLPLSLTTCLEAVAVRVAFPRLVTVCSLYLPDSVPLRVSLLTRLVSQLPPPLLLLGDFNSHNPLWGSSRLDALGHLVESFLTGADLLFLNTGLPTHFASHYRTFSHIDLSICSSSLCPLFEWSPADSLHDSDHYPLILRWSPGASLGSRHPRWIISRADWPAFQEACAATFPSITSLDVDSAVDCITQP